MQCCVLLCTEAHNYFGFALLLEKYLQYIYKRSLFHIYISLLNINKKKRQPTRQIGKGNSQLAEENTDKNVLNLSMM